MPASVPVLSCKSATNIFHADGLYRMSDAEGNPLVEVYPSIGSVTLNGIDVPLVRGTYFEADPTGHALYLKNGDVRTEVAVSDNIGLNGEASILNSMLFGLGRFSARRLD